MRKVFVLKLFIALIGFFPFSLFAHNKISGKVLSKDRLGLYGASIVIKGSNNGTISDEWGNFTLVTDENRSNYFEFKR